MKTGRTLDRAGWRVERLPRRLQFEQLESRQMLSGWGGVDAAAHAVPGDASGPATVLLRLQATDLCGQPIDRVAVGDEFWLEVYVQDLRPVPKGVFAAYLDVSYDAALVSPGSGENAGLIFGTTYVNGKSGEFSAGVIDEAGAFAGIDQTHGNEYLVFAVPLTATAAGVADFADSAADLIGHDVLVYGSDYPVPWEEVRVLGAQVIVAAGEGADQAAVGGAVDADWSLACRGAPAGGSGAELATTQPLERPLKSPSYEPYSYPPDSDASSRSYAPEETAEPWSYADARPTETESNVGGGWADEVWFAWSPIAVVPVTLDWGWGEYAYDVFGEVQDVISRSHEGTYRLTTAAWSSSSARSDFTVTFAEQLDARLANWSVSVMSGSELLAVVPAESAAPDAGFWYAFETLEARGRTRGWEEASSQVSDVGGTDENDDRLSDAFPGWTVPAGPEQPLTDQRGRPAAEPARAERDLERLAAQLDLSTAAVPVGDLLPAMLR